MPIYMNWGGTIPPAIKGDVTDGDHLGWIELSSAQFSSRAPIARNEGTPKASEPRISEITVTKVHDAASGTLFRESLQGNGTIVIIDFVKTTTGKPQVYLSITLSDAMISSYSMSGKPNAQGPAMESLTLSATKIQYGPAAGVQPHDDPIPNQNPGSWHLGAPTAS